MADNVHHGDRREGDTWKIDRKIPVAVIVTIALQTLAVVVFFTRLDGRVTSLEAENNSREWQSERIIRMDERLTSLQNNVSEIKAMLQPASRSK